MSLHDQYANDRGQMRANPADRHAHDFIRAQPPRTFNDLFKEMRTPIDRGLRVRIPIVKRPPHPDSERFHRILAELGELHDQKQRDYGTDESPFANVEGSDEWGVESWVGAMIRATDKVRRLQTFVRRGTLANEGVIDAFNDLAVYAVIARVLYEKTLEEQEEADAYEERQRRPIDADANVGDR